MPISISDFVRNRARDVIYLLTTRAPISVILSFLTTLLRYAKSRQFHKTTEQQVRIHAENTGEYSTEWFAASAPYWVMAFRQNGFTDRPVSALEIGSWEGRSAVFLLDHLPNAQLTAVDTWAGSDEHPPEQITDIERRFDENLAPYSDRLRKYKGMSVTYFLGDGENEKFDLIYVDGSHHSDDVLLDAIKAFARLNKGGILIFDDYLWRFYTNNNDNPAAAINAFLRMRRGEYKIIFAHNQLGILKTTG